MKINLKKIDMNYIKKQMKIPSFFLAFLTSALIIIVLILGLITKDFGSKGNAIATPADASSDEATPGDALLSGAAVGIGLSINLPETDPEEELKEKSIEDFSSDTEVTEDNYIDAVIAVVTDTYDEHTPITADCLRYYVNEYFAPDDIISITPVESMCNLSGQDVVFNVETSDGVTCYQARIAVSKITNQINYIGLIALPGSSEPLDEDETIDDNQDVFTGIIEGGVDYITTESTTEAAQE